MGYIERHIESRLKEALDIHPVVILSGPRQVGKSTLLQNAACLKGWRYITLDDSILLEQAKEDPQGLLLNE
ncbi:MAG TPA: AAA family ATPase, partial [Candidatus Omnitrophota bacterium]|nr:AAA family ATPase [Candidatus Omnitrophota bacterium]